MDREVVESARMATVLIIISATLVITTLAFMIARQYGGEFFNSSAEQQRAIDVTGLSGLSYSGGTEMPVASLYTILSREWRNIASITVTDSSDTVITTGTPSGSSWVLSKALTNSAGNLISRVSGPEQVLYAKAPNARGDRLEGRVYVTVVQDSATLTFNVKAMRLD